MYVLVKEGQVSKYPYGFGQLRADNPDTSFPIDMPEERLAEWGVLPVVDSPMPSAAPDMKVVESTPQFLEGRWYQVWQVVAHTEDEAAQKAAQMRSNRTRLLAESDWTQLPDSPVDRTAWAVYRQALRDITKQAGFPWAIEWPAEPV